MVLENSNKPWFQVAFNHLHGFKWFSLVVVTSHFLTKWYYFQCLFYLSFIFSFSICFFFSIIFPNAYNMEKVMWEVRQHELPVFAWICWITWSSCSLNVYHLYLVLSLAFPRISSMIGNFFPFLDQNLQFPTCSEFLCNFHTTIFLYEWMLVVIFSCIII